MVSTESTQQYYETHAESYASKTLGVDLSPLWSVLTSRLKPDSTILDLGCGAGRDLKFFADRGYHVTGLDSSANLATIASAVSGRAVHCADFLEPLPFQDRQFDAVWAIASLLHVPRPQIRTVLQEVARVLRPQGLFIASMKLGLGTLVDEGRLFVGYAPEEWRECLRASGFIQIETFENEELRRNGLMRIEWIVSACRKAQ